MAQTVPEKVSVQAPSGALCPKAALREGGSARRQGNGRDRVKIGLRKSNGRQQRRQHKRLEAQRGGTAADGKPEHSGQKPEKQPGAFPQQRLLQEIFCPAARNSKKEPSSNSQNTAQALRAQAAHQGSAAL